MSDIAIMTDSNCGIMPGCEPFPDIHIIPMPVLIDGETFYEGKSITAEEFYRKLASDAAVSTSLPSPGDVMDMWSSLLRDYKELVYIPMSSGLSTSCASALALASEGEFEGRVHVVDNHRISVTQTQSVLDAHFLAEEGKTGRQIKEHLEEEALDASIYIAVDTLKYLKRGGRITPAAAAVGTVLNLKPVLTIQGDKLDAFAKVRGMKAAFRTMCKAVEKDIDTRFSRLRDAGVLKLGMAETAMSEEDFLFWKEKYREYFPDMEIVHYPLTMSIGCHTGAGALGVGVFRVHRP